jgi:hypothetical protein
MCEALDLIPSTKSIFTDNNGIKVENNIRSLRKIQKVLKLNSIPANKSRIKEKNQREITNNFE